MDTRSDNPMAAEPRSGLASLPASRGAAMSTTSCKVAYPSSGAPLLLAEGLNEGAWASTLHGAICEALRRRVRTADMVKAGTAATTREFSETVPAELLFARRGPFR